jgi:hypothetical protein
VRGARRLQQMKLWSFVAIQLALPQSGEASTIITWATGESKCRRRSKPHGGSPAKPARRQVGVQTDLWSYVVIGRKVREKLVRLEWVAVPVQRRLPADYPDRRPKRYAYCQCLGLGTKVPCGFASCRHSLLSDEYRGAMAGEDVDLWTRETCSLAVARRRRHNALEIAAITSFCETTAEEWLRRAVKAVKAGLGIAECDWPPQHKGYRIQPTEFFGITELVAKMPERPKLNVPLGRTLSRAEVALLYGARNVHREYGVPRPPTDSAHKVA